MVFGLRVLKQSEEAIVDSVLARQVKDVTLLNYT